MKTKIIPKNQVARFAKANKQREKIIKRRTNILGCDIRVRAKGVRDKIYTTPYGKKIARRTIGAIGWLQLSRERTKVWYGLYSEEDYPAWDIVWKKVKIKKPECKKSPTGKHEWEETKEIPDQRGNDWGCVPGFYCVHCSERKKEELLKEKENFLRGPGWDGHCFGFKLDQKNK